MAKKTLYMLIAILLLSCSAAMAGDIPESIMSGSHKALLIGQILKINADTIDIKPLTIMMGGLGQAELCVQRFESYSFDPHYPKKGDYLVAILIDENTIDETWVFECTSADYKTLKLDCWQYDIVVRYQTYINEGAYFEAQKRLDARKASAAATKQATNAPTPDSSMIASAAPSEPAAANVPVSGNQVSLPQQTGMSGTIPVAAGIVLILGLIAIALFNRRWRYHQRARWRW